jgi:acetolactate synthase-1/2/3 large subunit
VLCVNGDGAFGIGAMEMDTAIRHDLPFICVIGNDQCWGMIERSQRQLFGEDRLVAASLGDRPYDAMVKALGGYGERVEDPDQIRPALERARDSGKAACLKSSVLSDRLSERAAHTPREGGLPGGDHEGLDHLRVLSVEREREGRAVYGGADDASPM